MTTPFKPKVVLGQKLSPEDIAAMKAAMESLQSVETPGQKVNTIIGDLVSFVRTLTIEDAETLARDVRRMLEDIIDISKQAYSTFSAHSSELRNDIIEKGINEALLKYGFKAVEPEVTQPDAVESAETNQADTTDALEQISGLRASEDTDVRLRNLEAQVKKLLDSEEEARVARMLEKQALEETLGKVLEALRKS